MKKRKEEEEEEKEECLMIKQRVVNNENYFSTNFTAQNSKWSPDLNNFWSLFPQYIKLICI